MATEDSVLVFCFWGSVDLKGNWYPNPYLKMSAEQQFIENEKGKLLWQLKTNYLEHCKRTS